MDVTKIFDTYLVGETGKRQIIGVPKVGNRSLYVILAVENQRGGDEVVGEIRQGSFVKKTAWSSFEFPVVGRCRHCGLYPWLVSNEGKISYECNCGFRSPFCVSQVEAQLKWNELCGLKIPL